MFWGFTVTVQFLQGFTKICDFSTYILSTNKTTFTYPCGQYLLENYYEKFNITNYNKGKNKLNKQKQNKFSCYFKPSKFYPYKCCLINTPWLDLMNSIYIAHIWVILNLLWQEGHYFFSNKSLHDFSHSLLNHFMWAQSQRSLQHLGQIPSSLQLFFNVLNTDMKSTFCLLLV